MEFGTMLSARGKKLIIVDGYKFRKDRETAAGVRYRCANKACVAGVTMDLTEAILLKKCKEEDHCHSRSANGLEIEVSL